MATLVCGFHGGYQLASGQHFRILNLVDGYSWECVGQAVDTLIYGEHLTRYQDELSQQYVPAPNYRV